MCVTVTLPCIIIGQVQPSCRVTGTNTGWTRRSSQEASKGWEVGVQREDVGEAGENATARHLGSERWVAGVNKKEEVKVLEDG
jgi:hypothetical protein